MSAEAKTQWIGLQRIRPGENLCKPRVDDSLYLEMRNKQNLERNDFTVPVDRMEALHQKLQSETSSPQIQSQDCSPD